MAKGATDEEVAKALGVSVRSIAEYKNKFPQFLQAFARAREKVVIEIKDALLKKALGFTYEEEKRSGRKDKNGENIILIEKFTRYCPPSETAAAMLLRNYDKEWKDTDNATAELRKQAQELKKAIAETNNLELILNEETD